MRQQLSDEQLKLVAQFLTNEHSALQTARSGTIFDANGRATLYLTTLSSVVVALSFIGESSKMGQTFYVFSLVLIPCLYFLGLVTFNRTLQAALEDTIYARGLSRIRHFYAEVVPPIKEYLVLATNDDTPSIVRSMGVKPSKWQFFMTTAGMVAVINSVVAGVFVALIGGWLSLTLPLCIGSGVLAFAISEVIHTRYQLGEWQRLDQTVQPIFTPDSNGQQNGKFY